MANKFSNWCKASAKFIKTKQGPRRRCDKIRPNWSMQNAIGREFSNVRPLFEKFIKQCWLFSECLESRSWTRSGREDRSPIIGERLKRKPRVLGGNNESWEKIVYSDEQCSLSVVGSGWATSEFCHLFARKRLWMLSLDPNNSSDGRRKYRTNQ